MFRLYRFFPAMTECPEPRQAVSGWLYWAFHILFLPGIAVVISPEGSLLRAAFWFWAIDLIAVVLIFRRFLGDSMGNFRIYRSECFTALWQGLLVFAVLCLPVYLIDGLDGMLGCITGGPFGSQDLTGWTGHVYFDPVSENLMRLASTSMICTEVLTGPVLVLASPVIVGCLYFALGFAPRADRQPWRGYAAVAAMAAGTTLLLHLSGGEELTACVIRYLCQLPFWMCGCWVYQRSNTVWGPILFTAAVNLLSALIFIAGLTVSYFAWMGL